MSSQAKLMQAQSLVVCNSPGPALLLLLLSGPWHGWSLVRSPPSLPSGPRLCELQNGEGPVQENQVQRETSYLVSRGPSRDPLAFSFLLIPYSSHLSKPCWKLAGFQGPAGRKGEKILEAEEDILEPALYSN